MRHLLTSLLVTISLFTPVAAHASVAVETDGDSYLVTGGVIHDEIYAHDREEAAHCTQCFWKITVICQNWLDAAHGNCPYWRLKCPTSMRLAEVYRANAPSRPPTTSSLWMWQGFTCLHDLPASTQLIEREVLETWRVLVPPLIVHTTPARNTVVNLMTDIESDSSSVIPSTTRMIGGNEVMVRATSRRTFECNSSCRYWTHAVMFRTPGRHALAITALWTGFFSVDGVSDIAIADPPIIQRASLPINAYRVARHLIPNPKGHL
ncbi:MAG: hypothetical protein RL410_1273 [Actinomycetota bacterium]|jgi:hypothetical protein